MHILKGHSVVNPERTGTGLARGRGRRILGGVLLVSAIAATLAGCVVAPGYVAPAPVYYAPAPVYYAPAPVVVAPAPIFVYGRWGGRRW